jgi:hypothetical protein
LRIIGTASPHECSYKVLANELLEKDEKDIALELFKLNADTYPKSPKAMDSLGDAYTAIMIRTWTYRKGANILQMYMHCSRGIAGGGARTHTILRSLDFESSASASSATPAFGNGSERIRASGRSSNASDEIERL